MRVDIHHHYFPNDLNKKEENKALGWTTPEGNLPWSPDVSLKAMKALNVDKAILSLPAIPVFPPGLDSCVVARERNEFVAQIRDTYPDKFGFFANLPALDDVEGVKAEISYALDVLKADGIALASCCGKGPGAKYIGHDSYDHLWNELNKRQAVVFLHGASIPSLTPYPHEFLGIPICDTPNETFKAAAHLVVTGRKRKYPHVKIILAHLGGTTPFLASRIAVLSGHMGCSLSVDEILEDFQSFYYETALSASYTTLKAMESFVSSDKILFGTDIPAVNAAMAQWYTNNLEKYYDHDQVKLDAVMYGNAAKIIPSLQI